VTPSEPGAAPGPAPEGWSSLIASLRPHVSPEWSRYAEEHGGQAWIRLILMVDAHHQLSMPRVAEKVAMTMADLAVDREGERQGWEAVREKAEEDRIAIVTELVDAAPAVLSQELLPLFARSIEPLQRQGM
jgi:hypothetical protein